MTRTKAEDFMAELTPQLSKVVAQSVNRHLQARDGKDLIFVLHDLPFGIEEALVGFFAAVQSVLEDKGLVLRTDFEFSLNPHMNGFFSMEVTMYFRGTQQKGEIAV